jgi:hypothetical protein
MLNTVSGTLVLFSIALYVAEFGLVILIRRRIEGSDPRFDDFFTEQMANIFISIRAEHVAAYSVIYFLILYSTFFIPLAVNVLVTLQLVSISSNVFLYTKLLK